MTQRYHYWSCSKLANWVRGTSKPRSGTMDEWRDWKNLSKNSHPIRYWVAEKGLNKLQNLVYWIPDQYNKVEIYISNRFVTKTHALVANPKDIQPGNWRDLSDRILPCLFNSLVDYVEIEKASMTVYTEDQPKQPWHKRITFPWTVGRDKDAGIRYLRWEMGLIHDESGYVFPGEPGYGEPTSQAIAAAEIMSLYVWWVEVYANRPDPYDVSGWNQKVLESDDIFDIFSDNQSEEQRQERADSRNDAESIEKRYCNEDTEMMIRLIKIRDALWT